MFFFSLSDWHCGHTAEHSTSTLYTKMQIACAWVWIIFSTHSFRLVFVFSLNDIHFAPTIRFCSFLFCTKCLTIDFVVSNTVTIKLKQERINWSVDSFDLQFDYFVFFLGIFCFGRVSTGVWFISSMLCYYLWYKPFNLLHSTNLLNSFFSTIIWIYPDMKWALSIPVKPWNERVWIALNVLFLLYISQGMPNDKIEKQFFIKF